MQQRKYKRPTHSRPLYIYFLSLLFRTENPSSEDNKSQWWKDEKYQNCQCNTLITSTIRAFTMSIMISTIIKSTIIFHKSTFPFL